MKINTGKDFQVVEAISTQDINIKGDLHEAEDPEEDLITISHRKVSSPVIIITKVTKLIEEVDIVMAAADTMLADGGAVGHTAESITQLLTEIEIFSRKTW